MPAGESLPLAKEYVCLGRKFVCGEVIVVSANEKLISFEGNEKISVCPEKFAAAEGKFLVAAGGSLCLP